MAIQEVQWYQACVELSCPMCEMLGDTPGVKLTRSSRLNSKRDGWVIVSFKCSECEWEPPALTFSLTPEVQPLAPARRDESLIIAPTEEEVEMVAAKPAPRRGRIVEPVRPNVTVEELLEHAEKKFPKSITLNKSGEKLERHITKWGNEDAAGIKVVYTDGKGNTIRKNDDRGVEGNVPNPFYVEKWLFCEPDLPDNQEFVDSVMDQLNVNRQQTNPRPRRVTQRPMLNSGRSKLRVTCGECGDTSGNCGCPGILRNIASPSGMKANTNLLIAPDGTPVPTLQERIAPETMEFS